MPIRTTIQSVWQTLWRNDRPLTAVGTLMLAVALVSVIAIVVDPRTITGVPAWLKPFKFAISTAIYSLTLAWVFGYLAEWPRVRRVVGWTTAVVFVLEVAIIDAQAWRGTTSHFNAATPLDMTLFAIMGSAIAFQTLLSISVAVALWRQRFADRALGWALRLGMTIAIVGASMGGLMTRPTAEQLAAARVSGSLPVSGAHTVGAADGGPGLPVTGWSLENGDLRIPHFIGMHALQAMPIVAFVLAWLGVPTGRRPGVLLAVAASYFTLMMILLWQALRGQALTAPDVSTIVALAVWVVASAVAIRLLSGESRASRGAGWMTV